MKDRAKRRADGERRAFRDRMRHGDKFNIKRPDRNGRSLRDDGDLNIRGAGLGKALGFKKRGGEPRRIDGAPKPRP